MRETRVLQHADLPSKRARLESPSSSSSTIPKACILQPEIQKLAFLEASDYETSIETFKMMLLIISNKSKDVHDHSWVSLGRMLTVRLGFVAGKPIDDIKQHHQAVLAIQTLRECCKQCNFDGSEMILAFQSVLKLMEATHTSSFLSEEGEGEKIDSQQTLFNHAMALIELWAQSIDFMTRIDDDLCSVENLILTLIKSSAGKTWRCRCIDHFARLQKSSFPCVASKFKIAECVLAGQNESTQMDSEDGMLFLLRCIHANGRHRPSEAQLSSLVATITESKSTSLFVSALKTLQSCSVYLNENHVSQSIEAIWGSRSSGISWRFSTSALILVLATFESLLDHSSATHPAWVEILDFCIELTNDGVYRNEKVIGQGSGSSATSLLLSIVKKLVQHDLSTQRKKFFFWTIDQQLRSSKSFESLASGVSILCSWIYTSNLRRDIMDLYPKLLTTLSQIIVTHQTSPSDTLKILSAFQKILSSEPSSNILARQPKLLDALVSAASPQGSQLLSEKIRFRAIQMLLALSENPCNHRVLAKQHGLLSIMIHCARQFQKYEIGQDVKPGSGISTEKLKQQILILAQAL